jgi:carbon storage regulator
MQTFAKPVTASYWELNYPTTSIKHKECAMLVLTRQIGETVVLQSDAYEDINITVTQIAGGQVRLAISAPDAVDIWRQELLEESD